ncbi:MAG: DUF2851 family protein [Bacteroidota bacterium]
MLLPIIREDLLYYIWKTKSFDLSELTTTDGQPIKIHRFGNQNFDAGPDFSNGKIKIGNTIWVGNVEMHVYSSDWERHCHDVDKAYDNVILHVVYEHNKEVFTTTEQKIPCLELKDRISKELLKRYSQLIAEKNWIPCEKQLKQVEEHTLSFWLQRLVAERIDSKTGVIKTILDRTNTNWEETLYISLCRYMGARVNMDPFESLAQSLPYVLVQKKRNDIHLIESLLFGQAGMLEANFKDDYFQSLKEEYRFLARKYKLKSLSPVAWKFARMRPVGFPTIRIAQLAQILFQNDRLFSKIIFEEEISRLRKLFKVKTSTYWDTHYRFGKDAKYQEKNLGNGFIDQLIINVISPMVFLYGKYIADEQFCERAIGHLESIGAEENKIIRNFKSLGVSCKSAADTQALLQLKQYYCDEKQCMSCAIGSSILKQKV